MNIHDAQIPLAFILFACSIQSCALADVTRSKPLLSINAPFLSINIDRRTACMMYGGFVCIGSAAWYLLKIRNPDGLGRASVPSATDSNYRILDTQPSADIVIARHGNKSEEYQITTLHEKKYASIAEFLNDSDSKSALLGMLDGMKHIQSTHPRKLSFIGKLYCKSDCVVLDVRNGMNSPRCISKGDVYNKIKDGWDENKYQYIELAELNDQYALSYTWK